MPPEPEATAAGSAEPSPPAPPPEKLIGVGGWLAWFTLGAFVSPLVILGGTFGAWADVTDQDWNAIVSLAPVFAFAKGYEMCGAVVIAASLLGLAVLLVRKHRDAALVAVVVLTTLPVFYVFDMLFTAASLNQLHAALRQMGRPIPAANHDDTIQTLRAIASSLIWFLYFFKSKRVRHTFGPVTWRGVAALLGRGKTVAALLLVCALIPAESRAQQVFRDGSGRFALVPPEGWELIPDSALAAASAPGNRFQAGFYRAGAREYFAYPYVLLRVLPGIPIEPESVAAELSAIGNAPNTGDRTAFPAHYDRSSDVVRWGGLGRPTGALPLRYYTAIRMTRFGQLAVFAYGLTAESLATARILDAFVEGLMVDSAHAYRRDEQHANPLVLEVLGGLAFLGITAGVLALMRVLGARTGE